MPVKTSELLFRWVPTFLAFPLGGLISRLAIGSASNLAKALGGSLLVGLVVGLAQFVALKKFGVAPSWAIATTLATTIAALANSLIFSYKFDSTSLVGSGLVAGSLVGLAQSLSDTRRKILGDLDTCNCSRMVCCLVYHLKSDR